MERSTWKMDLTIVGCGGRKRMFVPEASAGTNVDKPSTRAEEGGMMSSVRVEGL